MKKNMWHEKRCCLLEGFYDNVSLSQTLNVRCIDLHLGSFGIKCMQIHRTLSVWVFCLGIHGGNDHRTLSFDFLVNG